MLSWYYQNIVYFLIYIYIYIYKAKLANLVVIYSTRFMIRLDPSLNATLVGFINYSANCSA